MLNSSSLVSESAQIKTAPISIISISFTGKELSLQQVASTSIIKKYLNLSKSIISLNVVWRNYSL
ncbi:hypothetical protein PALB_15130 [Pseudoalteromonas luteoviolacea B = ATCC 29581]|nr:hypothetical protein PALB_15130 [Pseudoalteromonas luteoviolacea B = ATCC 29581]